MKYNLETFEIALKLLSARLAIINAPHYNLVVCGGTALMAANLILRQFTKDVDVIALMDESGNLVDPEPLPHELLESAKIVALDLGLPDDWLNNGPSHGEGGLFRMGLPEGFSSRLTKKEFGGKLTAYFSGRLDQIHFKLYAAVDRSGGYHAEDLLKLSPTDDEMLMAARWSITHDVSEGYKMSLINMLKVLGYAGIIDKL